MAEKTVALSVDEEIYDKYRNFCEKRGIILSKQAGNFMKQELEANKV